ncbi:hypothetical protein AALC25_11750 [Lachnospiraceae bacterium 29-84]
MGGENFSVQKEEKKRRKDKAILFDNSVIAEEESDYVIKDEEGNIIHPDNRMALIFHPNYKHYL